MSLMCILLDKGFRSYIWVLPHREGNTVNDLIHISKSLRCSLSVFFSEV